MKEKVMSLEVMKMALEYIERHAILDGIPARDALRSAIEQAETAPAAQPSAPEGWKLVPETPTNEMTSAMADALEDPENERSSWDLAENMYRVMFAAAPEKGN